MTEIVQGLFGVSPEQLQMQQDQALQARAMQYAQMSPQEQATSGIYTGVSKLGGALGGMLGGVDPVQQQASKIASVLQGADRTTAEGMMNIAKRFADVGLPQQSQMAVAKAQEMAKASSALAVQGAETLLKTAQAGAIPGETALRLAQAKKAGFDQLSEEQAQTAARAALVKQGNMSSEQIEAIVKNPKSRESYFGYIADKTQITEANGRVLLVNKEDGTLIKDLGAAPEKGTKINLNVSQKGAEAGAVEIAKLDAKRLGDASLASDKAIEQAGVLKQILNTPQPIAGAGAPSRVAALRVFSTLGLTSAKDEAALGNADTFNALAGERVLGFIKALGSNPTDTDREFARSIGPALEKGTKTNTDLTNYLLKRANETVTAASDMRQHFYANNYSLKGYASPFISNVTPVSKYSDLSDAELAARITAAKAKVPK